MTATLGLELEVGGQRGDVIGVGDEGVLVQIGTARMDVAYGAPVTIGGRTARLRAPGPPAEGSAGSHAIEHALRAWRSAKARAEHVPAYVIMKDADLIGVAEQAPASLAELRHCRGMGPLRLERYGDEILAIIDELRT